MLVQSRLVVQVVFRDLTARKTAEAELRHAHERLARHMDNTPLAVVELACQLGDDVAWRVKAWSGQAEAMFGWAAAEATGRTLQELALVHEAERDKAVLLRRDLLGQRPRTATTLRCRTRTGEVRHCRIHASVVPGDAGRPEAALLLVEDITDLVAAQESVHRLAQHDELTGLPNRLLFQDRLGQALARAGREGELLGVMLLDLDHFKEVNDTLGHSAGDALLGEVAARLRACARESDTWARLGGDEFALVQAGLREPGGAAVMARRVLEALAAPIRVEEQELEVGASLGVTVFPGDGDTPERLVRNADVALYRAKAAGRGRFRFYRPEMDRELQDNRSLQRGLREALDTRGLRLVYQPVFGLPNRHVGKVEALLRWPHPGGGFVPPSTFIPIAEASGLIRPLGQWVLREACRQAAAWRAEGLRLKVAVNVSAAQLRDPGLPEAVRAALRDADLEAGLLELELTESVFLDPSKEQIVQTLRKVAGLGVTLAIDDFGTGYSSLAYLKHFPFHEVRVDGSFVADIGREPGGEAIVAAVVALAHNLGKRATAEGVESPEQLAFLGERGCAAAQGFLLGRPQGPSEIGNLLLAAT